jgi:hypothetical protein
MAMTCISMRAKINAYKLLSGNVEGKSPLVKLYRSNSNKQTFKSPVVITCTAAFRPDSVFYAFVVILTAKKDYFPVQFNCLMVF